MADSPAFRGNVAHDDGRSSDHEEVKKDGQARSDIANKHPRLLTIAKYCPLIAAVFAPLATLLDIPALTQHWYTLDDVPQSDPTASLVLSAIGLGLNILANALLILRFSSRTRKWVWYTVHWSLACWLGKTIVAAVNLILFGLLTRNSPGYEFAEGFWCAVVSLCDAGIISFALLFHFIFARRQMNPETIEIRIEGRKFMLSVTAFLGIVAIQALVFSKIEGWEYADGIYFSVQTALTIGYGDFTPETAAGKVLILPFAILTISQLGNEISIIIDFVRGRTDARRARWRKKYEGAMHKEAERIRPRAGLLEEMALVHQINKREETLSQYYDLIWSAMSLLTFWLIGAVMFSRIQGWSYGDAVYAVIILSTTIGFGDYTPDQPAARIVWIPYALMAVPLVTSFAVQTITGLLSTFAKRGSAREAFRTARTLEAEMFRPHSDIVNKLHARFSELRNSMDAKRLEKGGVGKPEWSHSSDSVEERLEPPSSKSSSDPKSNPDAEPNEPAKSDATASDDPNKQEPGENGDHKGEEAMNALAGEEDDVAGSEVEATAPEEEEKENPASPAEGDGPVADSNGDDNMKTAASEKALDIQRQLLEQLMDRVICLEAEARQMLLDSMENGIARTLLLADRNVQIRDVRAIREDDANILSIWRGEEADAGRALDMPQASQFVQVKRYRHTFAEILVLGSTLRGLEGEEKEMFERWRGAGTKRSGPSDRGRKEGGGGGADTHTGTGTNKSKKASHRGQGHGADTEGADDFKARLDALENDTEFWNSIKRARAEQKKANKAAKGSRWRYALRHQLKRGNMTGSNGNDDANRNGNGQSGARNAEDLDEVAEEEYAGITSRILRRQVGKELKSLSVV